MSTNLEITLNSIKEKLIKHYAPNSIILFGSYLDGSFDEEQSDLDLLIVKDTKDRFIDRWKNVREILSDPNRKIPIETIIITPGTGKTVKVFP